MRRTTWIRVLPPKSKKCASPARPHRRYVRTSLPRLCEPRSCGPVLQVTCAPALVVWLSPLGCLCRTRASCLGSHTGLAAPRRPGAMLLRNSTHAPATPRCAFACMSQRDPRVTAPILCGRRCAAAPGIRPHCAFSNTTHLPKQARYVPAHMPLRCAAGLAGRHVQGQAGHHCGTANVAEH